MIPLDMVTRSVLTVIALLLAAALLWATVPRGRPARGPGMASARAQGAWQAAPPAGPRAGQHAGAHSPEHAAQGVGTLRTLLRSRTVDALQVAQLVDRLATVIAAGVAPRRAWLAVASATGDHELAQWTRAVSAGADLQRAAPPPLARHPAVRALAAALAVCERTGAPTAPVLSVLARALRDLHDASQARRSAFAGPRSTARILLVLPLAGLGLGALLGADPLEVLLSSPVGHVLTLLGAGLTALGWWWMRRLLAQADPPPDPGIDPSVVLELIAGALRAGLPLPQAARAVAECAPRDPNSSGLQRFAAALAAGMPPQDAACSLPAGLRPLGESAVLAASAGADLSGVLRCAAEDARRGRAREAEVRAARLGVRLVVPTGATLLPAFLVLGVIPTVLALLGGSLGLASTP